MEKLTLAEKCQVIRIKMRISQAKMAKLVGTNQTEISFVERGFLPRDCAKIEKIEALWKAISLGIPL